MCSEQLFIQGVRVHIGGKGSYRGEGFIQGGRVHTGGKGSYRGGRVHTGGEGFIQGGKGGVQNPSISSPYNESFLLCYHFPIQYIHPPLHHNVTYSLHTFSQQQCHLILLGRVYSSSHFPATTILLALSASTHRSLSNYQRVINPHLPLHHS